MRTQSPSPLPPERTGIEGACAILGLTRRQLSAKLKAKKIPGALEVILKKIPMQRVANPSETAEAICWLLSDRSSFVTGQTIAVDGGMLAGRIYV